MRAGTAEALDLAGVVDRKKVGTVSLDRGTNPAGERDGLFGLSRIDVVLNPWGDRRVAGLHSVVAQGIRERQLLGEAAVYLRYQGPQIVDLMRAELTTMDRVAMGNKKGLDVSAVSEPGVPGA